MPNPTPVSSPAGGATRESVRDVVTVAWKLFQDQDCTCQAEDAGWCWYHLSDAERLERIIALVEMRFPSVAATPASSPREETSDVDDAIELAWGIIANAGGGNWDLESPEWREAAARWRDTYYGPFCARAAQRAQSASVPAPPPSDSASPTPNGEAER